MPWNRFCMIQWARYWSAEFQTMSCFAVFSTATIQWGWRGGGHNRGKNCIHFFLISTISHSYHKILSIFNIFAIFYGYRIKHQYFHCIFKHIQYCRYEFLGIFVRPSYLIIRIQISQIVFHQSSRFWLSLKWTLSMLIYQIYNQLCIFMNKRLQF